MTVPEMFELHWERTGGDFKRTISAVKASMREVLPRRPPLGAPSKDWEVSWRNSRKIIAAISVDSELEVSEVMGRNRHTVVARARSIAMLMIRHMLVLSYPEIGSLFQGRDHTTVLSNCKAAEVWLASRPLVFARLQRLCEAAISPSAPDIAEAVRAA